jgi:sugar phosphate isomerase/epimerase
MFFGYNTNGFAHHRLDDALTILAELGYQGVALTLDYHALDPLAAELKNELPRIRRLLEKLQLRSVIESGARFLLDPRRKHQPTLISPTAAERQRRLEFLMAAVRIAAELGSDAVSFWSGTAVDDVGPDVWRQRLIDGCRRLCDVAAELSVRLAFEPEPGMFIDTMARFAELHKALSHPALGLTVDIGHLHCQGEVPIADYLRRWRHILCNVHIEDMRRAMHEHLMFGEGEIDFGPIMSALREIGYSGGVYVELSRHSHDAVATAEKSLGFLRSLSNIA